MPPKRKRATEEATTATETSSSARTTRTSARSRKIKETKVSGENELIPMDTDDTAPSAKKSRASAKGTTKATTKKGKSASKMGDDDESSGPRKPSLTEANSAPQGTSKSSSTAKRQTKTQSTTTPEPYTLARATALFENYADQDDPTVIGAEGFERLCNDANIALDGALPLILAWQFGCKEMAKITLEEWNSGTSALKISSASALSIAVGELEDLFLSDKPPPTKKTPEPYNQVDFWKYCENKKEAFKKFYFFCFALAKPEGSRNIDIETASAMWGVLLVPKYQIMSDVVAFIGEKEGIYKASNKDLWNMMLEFCDTVNPNLSDYESDGAWPTLLDDFVSWKKESLAGEQMQTNEAPGMLVL